MSSRGTGSETVARFFERLGRQFADASRMWGPATPYGRWVSAAEAMPIDLVERGDEFVVTVDLPGFEHDDVDVRVTGRTLRIEAESDAVIDEDEERFRRRERGHGSTRRSVRLPEEVDAEGVKARMTNGVLTVTLPKLEGDDF